MLSRGKVTPLTVSYYTDEVAAGLEDYYAGRGEAVGHWVASGSAAAGLAGEVSAEQLCSTPCIPTPVRPSAPPTGSETAPIGSPAGT